MEKEEDKIGVFTVGEKVICYNKDSGDEIFRGVVKISTPTRLEVARDDKAHGGGSFDAGYGGSLWIVYDASNGINDYSVRRETINWKTEIEE